MPEVRRIVDDAPWVEAFGYARAVRHLDRIEVSGTTASGPGGVPTAPDVEGQTAEAIRRIAAACDGLVVDHERWEVVRTRVYLTDASTWPEAGRAHRAAFAATPPANTTLAVAALVGDGLLVEIEASAVVLSEEAAAAAVASTGDLTHDQGAAGTPT